MTGGGASVATQSHPHVTIPCFRDRSCTYEVLPCYMDASMVLMALIFSNRTVARPITLSLLLHQTGCFAPDQPVFARCPRLNRTIPISADDATTKMWEHSVKRRLSRDLHCTYLCMEYVCAGYASGVMEETETPFHASRCFCQKTTT